MLIFIKIFHRSIRHIYHVPNFL